MFEEIIDKNYKTIKLKTDYKFTDFRVEKYREHFHFNFMKNSKERIGGMLYFNQFGGRKYYPNMIFIVNIDIKNRIVNLRYE